MTWLELRRHIPNALTIARFAAVPVFAWLYLRAGDGAAWGAGLFFAAAAATDQIDGYLARRWDVHTAFGKIADPLADRVMIGTAVILMWATGRIPLAAALIVLARDLALVLGYKLLAPRGFELEVTFLGKLATWILYAALGFVLVTEEGTTWPLVILWIGIVLAIGAGVQYFLRARSALDRALKPASRKGCRRAPRMESLKLRLTPRIGDCFTHLTDEERRLVEPIPDLATLTDDDLRVMIRELEKEEDEISFRRRVLHGRIDILRAELVARLREQVSAGEAKLADVERLSEILAGRATSPGADDG